VVQRALGQEGKVQTRMKVEAAIGILTPAGVVYHVRSDAQANDFGTRTEGGMSLRCRACSHDFRPTFDMQDLAPCACPRCGKREAWPLWKCHTRGPTGAR